MDERYSLEIEPEPYLVPTVRMFAATLARQAGCAEETVFDVKLAVSEACTNAVQAHERTGVDSPIRIEVTESDDVLSYEIADGGGGLDTTPPDEPAEVFKHAAESGGHGMGLAVIRALFPDAEFNSSSSGTVVRFALPR